MWKSPEKRKQYQREYMRKWRLAQTLLYPKTVKVKQTSRQRQYWTKYRIRDTHIEDLIQIQKGKCPCGIPLGNEWVIDHDHLNGNVRSLMHPACNNAIGCSKDSFFIMLKAIFYLDYFKDYPSKYIFPGMKNSREIENIRAILLEQQNYLCFLCNTNLLLTGRQELDHDHKTGFVRAVLCQQCNLLLGWLDDNTIKMSNLALYLSHYYLSKSKPKKSKDTTP